MRQFVKKQIEIPLYICNHCGKEINPNARERWTVNAAKLILIKEDYDNILGADKEDLCKPCATEIYDKITTLIKEFRSIHKHAYNPRSEQDALQGW